MLFKNSLDVNYSEVQNVLPGGGGNSVDPNCVLNLSSCIMSNKSIDIHHSSYEPYEISKLLTGIIMSLYAIVMLISVGGNCIVCYIVFAMRGLRTVPNFFIASLSISDIVMTCFCLPFTVLSNIVFYYWPFAPFLCPVVGYLQIFMVLQRTLTLVALTCDCHYVTWRPLKKRITRFKAKIVIALLWSVAGIISIPTGLYSTIEYLEHEPGSKGICVETWMYPMAKYWYSLFIMFIQYFVPLTIMLITYCHIGIIIWINRVPGEADLTRDRRIAKSKRKTIKMFVVVFIYYVFAWLPLHVLTLVGDKKPEIYNEETVHVLWLFSQLLAFSNAASNPIIYGWMNQNFRIGYLIVFSKIGCFKPKTFQSIYLHLHPGSTVRFMSEHSARFQGLESVNGIKYQETHLK